MCNSEVCFRFWISKLPLKTFILICFWFFMGINLKNKNILFYAFFFFTLYLYFFLWVKCWKYFKILFLQSFLQINKKNNSLTGYIRYLGTCIIECSTTLYIMIRNPFLLHVKISEPRLTEEIKLYAVIVILAETHFNLETCILETHPTIYL